MSSPRDRRLNADCFQRALSEYRESSWCPDDFADLPAEVQRDITERASQIQEATDRLNEVFAEAA